MRLVTQLLLMVLGGFRRLASSHLARPVEFVMESRKKSDFILAIGGNRGGVAAAVRGNACMSMVLMPTLIRTKRERCSLLGVPNRSWDVATLDAAQADGKI